MYCDRSGAVFYRRDGDAAFAQLSGVRFTATPFAVNYRLYGEDVVILCSPRDGMAVWNGKEDAVIVGESPLITSLTLHYERMFVTIAGQKNAVWFSDDLDPTNWNPSLDEGGFIELTDERGRSNRVLSFLNYVYVLRDYGITRLTAQGKQTDFAAANLFVSGGRIYPETAAVCGDAVLFLCSDGFYSFDGVSTRRILKHLDGVLTAKGSPSAAYVGGKYFVSLRLRAETCARCVRLPTRRAKRCMRCVRTDGWARWKRTGSCLTSPHKRYGAAD